MVAMKFISRSEMGWPSSAARAQPFPPKGVKVHYEGEGFPGFPHSRCVGHWTGIRNSHLANKEENYSDVAYNLAVCQHGYVLEGRGAGRQTGANGNQELNRNHYAIVVLIGGDTEPSPEAVGALKEAIQYLRDRGAGDEIKGHRDGYATSCPGSPLYHLVTSGSLEPSQEDDMPSPEDLWSYKIDIPNRDGKVSVADILAWTDNRHNVIYGELEALRKQVADLIALVKSKP
jgi:hypothetical protein